MELPFLMGVIWPIYFKICFNYRQSRLFGSLQKNKCMQISWDDFIKIDIRTGTIVDVQEFPKARKPAYKLWIDFGPELGIRKSSAQVTAHYQPADLLNRPVIAVVNFPPRQVADFMSECLVLGVYDENKDVILLQADRPLPNGLSIG